MLEATAANMTGVPSTEIRIDGLVSRFLFLFPVGRAISVSTLRVAKGRHAAALTGCQKVAGFKMGPCWEGLSGLETWGKSRALGHDSTQHHDPVSVTSEPGWVLCPGGWEALGFQNYLGKSVPPNMHETRIWGEHHLTNCILN